MKYHPHGDASIGSALVTLGQKGLLIDTQGNWGNILTGDSAAAPRYIEARLSPFEEFGESAWESREALLDAMEMCRKDGFAVKRSAAGLTLAFFLGCGRTIGFCLKDPAEKVEPVLRTVKSLIAAMKF